MEEAQELRSFGGLSRWDDAALGTGSGATQGQKLTQLGVEGRDPS